MINGTIMSGNIPVLEYKDNNIALISTAYPRYIERENDLLIKIFIEFLKEDKEALEIYKNINIPTIDKEFIANVIEELPKEVTERINLDIVKEFIANGYKKIQI